MTVTVLDLLKGKVVSIMTDAKVEVELTIESVSEENYSQDLEPRTQANDWWPATRDWTTYLVKFTNGYIKSYSSIEDIKLVR